jgi:hypothetical protein
VHLSEGGGWLCQVFAMPTHPSLARSRAGLSGSLPCLLLALALAGCAGPKYTVDDGRKVDETLLANIQRYARNERSVRPAIERSAALDDKECDRQWELPFAVASSQAWSPDDRVAWVRATGVDERLTVISAAPGSPLQPGDKLLKIQGRHDEDAATMSEWLADRRDDGKPFKILPVGGHEVEVKPFQVCRGYTRFAPPNTPTAQDFHWLMSMHPLDVADADLSEDEALWIVLWGQGLSEEGGLRMKTYHYGSKVVGTLYNLFTIASGLKGAAMAADAALKAAQQAAQEAATEVIKQQIIQQAKDYAVQRLQGVASDTGQRLLTAQAVATMQQAAVNRGALSGVARIGATVFDRADAWAFERAPQLGASSLAGFTLHQKLVERGLADSVFVFDVERLSALTKVAEAHGQGETVVAALGGLRPEMLAQAIEGMPLASTRHRFSYEDANDGTAAGPFQNGLIDASLNLPVASAHP